MRLPSNTAVGVGIGVGVGLAGLLAWKRLQKKAPPNTWEEVGEIGELILYPLKSGRGMLISEGQATEFGLAQAGLEDRSFMVMTTDGNFITCRQVGKLATVSIEVNGQMVTLRADGAGEVKFDLQEATGRSQVKSVRIWNQSTVGVDCGDDVAQWLTNYLYNGDTTVRLLFQGGLVKNRPARNMLDFPHFKTSDRLRYADTCAFMFGNAASLEDLNSRLAKPVDMFWFRPNLVVKGAKPFDEDDWAFVKVGEAVFRRVKPCERCLLTTVDPATGERHPEQEPLATLRQYRTPKGPPELAKVWAQKPVFGAHYAIDSLGPLKVGDKVKVVRASKHPEYQIMHM